MAIEVVRPGPQTSVQDLGRWNFQRYGVPVGGAMDQQAARMANLLVGNDPSCAVIEMAAIGASLSLTEPALVALCGAEMSAKVDGQSVPLNRPVRVQAGANIVCGAARRGCRAYLAVAGGIEIPAVLGSRSAYVRGGFSDLTGRLLQTGDRLQTGTPSHRSRIISQCLERSSHHPPLASVPWHVRSRLLSDDHEIVVLRAMRGSEYEWLDMASQNLLFEAAFTITANADRMGYRLSGPKLVMNRQDELLSEGVCPGTVQAPASGEPIVLMADCATTGGYPKVAHVASVDLPLLAQTPAGRKVRFQQVTIEQAQSLYREMNESMRQLAVAIELKWRDWRQDNAD